jgi:hypothetical protein
MQAIPDLGLTLKNNLLCVAFSSLRFDFVGPVPPPTHHLNPFFPKLCARIRAAALPSAWANSASIASGLHRPPKMNHPAVLPFRINLEQPGP